MMTKLITSSRSASKLKLKLNNYDWHNDNSTRPVTSALWQWQP